MSTLALYSCNVATYRTPFALYSYEALKQQPFLKYVAAGGITVATAYLGNRLAKSIWSVYGPSVKQRAFDICAHYLSSEIAVDYRRQFKACKVDMAMEHKVSNHSHKLAATNRCRANTLCDAFTLSIGKRVYSYSMSKTEIGKVDGNHSVYNGKDLSWKTVHNALTPHHVIRLTDVDYYVDMRTVLRGKHVLLYTFVPNVPAGNTGDSTFSVQRDNSIITVVNGGARYQHQLWDYDTDHLYVNQWYGTELYLIESVEIDQHHRVIFMNHSRTFYTPLAWLIPGFHLCRKQMAQGDYAVMKRQVVNEQKLVVEYCISNFDSCSTVVIPEPILEACHARYYATDKPQLSDVERIVRSSALQNPVYTASVVYGYLRANPMAMPITYSPCVIKHNTYQTLGPLVFEDGRTSTRIVAPPIWQGVFSPVRSVNNDVACIDGRVTAPRNRVTTYAPCYWHFFSEFVSYVIPNDMVGTCTPYNFEEQWAQLKRATQRSKVTRVLQSFFCDGNTNVQSFQKAETYAKVTNPRNISTLPAEHNFRFGMFVNGFSQMFLKPLKWYAFGKHPRELSRNLMDYATGTPYLIPTDLSKCDGSTGYIHYVLMNALYYRAFSEDYHDEVARLNSKEAYAKGYTSEGVEYDNLYQTLSGSAQTSVRNTCINAYGNYCALRKTYGPDESWSKLGLFGGDDGVISYVQPHVLESTFADLGMLIKAAVVPTGETVSFLGRLFIDPWTTEESIIDVARHVRKLHVTTTPKLVPTNVVMWRKALGYLATDPNTPVISSWAHMVMRLYPVPTDDEYAKHRAYERATSIIGQSIKPTRPASSLPSSLTQY